MTRRCGVGATLAFAATAITADSTTNLEVENMVWAHCLLLVLRLVVAPLSNGYRLFFYFGRSFFSAFLQERRQELVPTWIRVGGVLQRKHREANQTLWW